MAKIIIILLLAPILFGCEDKAWPLDHPTAYRLGKAPHCHVVCMGYECCDGEK